MDELGRLLSNICRVVPEGVVVFLPSFAFEQQLVQHWTTTGLWMQLQQHKKVRRLVGHTGMMHGERASLCRSSGSLRMRV